MMTNPSASVRMMFGGQARERGRCAVAGDLGPRSARHPRGLRANLLGWLGPANLSYSLANLIGSGILTIIAVVDQQLGFILLEGLWALVSLWGVIQVLRGRPPESTAGH